MSDTPNGRPDLAEQLRAIGYLGVLEGHGPAADREALRALALADDADPTARVLAAELLFRGGAWTEDADHAGLGQA